MLPANILLQAYAGADLLPLVGWPETHGMEQFDRKLMGGVLRRLRKASKMTQDQIAERMGWEQPRVSKVEKGKQEISVQDVADFAAALDLMASEVHQAYEMEIGIREDSSPVIPRPAPDARMVPRIGWVQAGAFTEVPELTPADIDGWVQTSSRVSKYAYALRVEGESMTNPRGSPSFPQGSTIIVEPRQGYADGSLVVVQRSGERAATFKRLATDAGRTYLVPLNPQYPTLTWQDGDRVCGVVVAIAEQALH